MSLTASQICTIARDRSGTPGYTQQSGQYLNNALEEIILTGDYEVARQAYSFSFSTAGQPTNAPNASQVQNTSGPYQLPPDYLRVKKGDIQYYPLTNYPFQLTPIDIEEFDHQVQQAGIQTFPIFWMTDITQRRVFKSTGGTGITAGSGTFTVADATGIAVGQGVFGDAIQPGTVTLVTNVAGASVTVSPAVNVIGTYTAPAYSALVFSTCPNAYVWPPAGGAYPAFLRYFRKMPDIWVPEASTMVPWFEYTDMLCDMVTARLMKDSRDPRATELNAEVRAELRRYNQMVDDRNNRARRITLDRRRFGSGWNVLPKSKILGW